jgi:hypothetical protein
MMQVDGVSRAVTRRAMMAAGIGSLAGIVATLLGRPLPVRGAGGQGATMTVGGVHTDATSTTSLSSPGQADPTMYVENQGNKAALSARSMGGDGLVGRTLGSGKSGVYGRSDSANSYGLYGFNSPAGTHGSLGGPTAGVEGTTQSGVALRGVASNKAGVALQIDGRIQVAKAAGKATIVAGTKTITVTPGVPITANTRVILTPRGPITMLWATTNATKGTITIRTNVNVAIAVVVNYLVIG